MTNISHESPWETLRIAKDDLGGIAPEELTTYPLIIVEFGGLDGIKPNKQPGACSYRVATVGKQLAEMLDGRFVHETVGRLLRTGVSEHVDGLPRYLQLNSSCADDRKQRKLPPSNFAVDFTLRLRHIPQGMTVADLSPVEQEFGILKDYNRHMYVQRPIDPTTGEEFQRDYQYLSDLVRPDRFVTLKETAGRVDFGDVAVFVNGLGDANSNVFPTHETESLRREETGEWRVTYDLPRTVALGRVVV